MTQTVSAPFSAPSVLEDVREQVAGLLDVLWAARTAGELTSTVTEVERLRSVLDAVELSVVAEVEATGASKHAGWASTKDFLTATAGGHRGHGPAMVRLAQAVTGARRRTLVALARGAVSRTQAEVITSAVDRLPSDAALRDEAEEHLLGLAATMDATDLAKAGKPLSAVVDPEGDERETERRLRREERAAHHSRFLTIADDGAGGVRISGRAAVEDAATIKPR